MVGFVLKRLALAAVILAVLSLLSFVFFASNTDPLQHHPVLPQYWSWLTGLWGGRSTRSLLADQTLWPTMLRALAHTSVLLATALVLVVVGSVGLGVTAARRPGSAVDLLLRGASYVAWGVPAFLLALILQLVMQNVSGSKGLGLFVAQDVAERHGGELRIRAGAPDGTRVTLLLPWEIRDDGRD